MFKKNGKLIIFLPTGKEFRFVEDDLIFNSNAIGVGIATVTGAAGVETTLEGALVAAAEAAVAASIATTAVALEAIAEPVRCLSCHR